MYNGIGLASVRGTATSGHVEKNQSYVRPSSERWKKQSNVERSGEKPQDFQKHKPVSKKGSQTNVTDEMRERQQKRDIENKLLELEDRLENGGVLNPEEIVVRVQEERDFLLGILEKEKKQEELFWQQVEEKEKKEEEERKRRELEQTDSTLADRIRVEPSPSGDALEVIENGDVLEHGEVAEKAKHVERNAATNTHNGPVSILKQRTKFRRDRPAQQGGMNRKDDTNSHTRKIMKEEDNARMQKAFNIGNDHEEGTAFDRDLQEKKKQERREKYEKKREEETRVSKRREKERRREERDTIRRRRREEKESAKENRKDHKSEEGRGRNGRSSSQSKSTSSYSKRSRKGIPSSKSYRRSFDEESYYSRRSSSYTSGSSSGSSSDSRSRSYSRSDSYDSSSYSSSSYSSSSSSQSRRGRNSQRRTNAKKRNSSKMSSRGRPKDRSRRSTTPLSPPKSPNDRVGNRDSSERDHRAQRKSDPIVSDKTPVTSSPSRQENKSKNSRISSTLSTSSSYDGGKSRSPSRNPKSRNRPSPSTEKNRSPSSSSSSSSPSRQKKRSCSRKTPPLKETSKANDFDDSASIATTMIRKKRFTPRNDDEPEDSASNATKTIRKKQFTPKNTNDDDDDDDDDNAPRHTKDDSASNATTMIRKKQVTPKSRKLDNDDVDDDDASIDSKAIKERYISVEEQQEEDDDEEEEGPAVNEKTCEPSPTKKGKFSFGKIFSGKHGN